MSKTSLFLLSIFLIIVGVFVYIKIANPYIQTRATISKANKETTSTPKTTLSFTPEVMHVAAGKINSIGMYLDTQGEIPSLVQFEIGYDPAVITVQNVIPGEFFATPKLLLNTQRPTSGRMSYALTCADTKACISNKKAAVVNLSFLVNPYSLKKETTITFFPKTLLQNENGNQIALQTQNAKIVIQGIMMQPASPSAALIP
jgi:hypothetical protein